MGGLGSIPGLGRSPGEGHGNVLQYSCLKNPHGQRNLAGYSPWGHKEPDMTERLSTALLPRFTVSGYASCPTDLRLGHVVNSGKWILSPYSSFPYYLAPFLLLPVPRFIIIILRIFMQGAFTTCQAPHRALCAYDLP